MTKIVEDKVVTEDEIKTVSDILASRQNFKR